MCDTIVALGNSTVDSSVIFGKNSDREPNEAHEVVIIPGAKHPKNSLVKCTYIEIPQVPESYQVLLAKPFWIWGAEMGSNEHGVTIGNEAVFTRIPYEKKPGLIGMDFLRLALERGKTAAGALDVITSLLEEFGQGGNCGFAHTMYYHNSFLICDFEEAWVLETAGREWAAEKVKDIRTISNAITITNQWDKCSSNLVRYAVEKGWCKSEADFSFAKCYSDTIYTTFSDARKRQACSSRGLLLRKGNITAGSMMEVLRSHGEDETPSWTPDNGVSGADICAHAGWGPIRGSQTTGSMISILKKDIQPTHWVTATSAPCTSVFKPVWMDAGVTEIGVSPTGRYDEAALYWRHESLHRSILRDYPSRIAVIRDERDALEKASLHLARANQNAPINKRSEISKTAFLEADEIEKKWMELVSKTPVKTKTSWLFRTAWNKFNKEAGMEIQ